MTKQERINLIELADAIIILQGDIQNYINEVNYTCNEEQLEALVMKLNIDFHNTWNYIIPELEKYEKVIEQDLK